MVIDVLAPGDLDRFKATRHLSVANAIEHSTVGRAMKVSFTGLLRSPRICREAG
jgi:hypothetical protein